MTEEKQQKFTAKVRRGLVWVHSVAAAELAKKRRKPPASESKDLPPVNSPMSNPR